MNLTGTTVQLENVPRAKCRTWELRVNLPKQNGRYPKRTRRFSGTYRQAQSALRDFIAQVEQERDDTPPSNFAEYARHWQRRRAESGMYEVNTVNNDATRVRALVHHLGDMDMSDITQRDIEDMYTAMMNGETPSGKPYAPKTIESMHKTLVTILNDAVRDDILTSAPVSDVKRPSVAPVARNVPSGDKIDALVESLDVDNPTELAVALCACCGLRRSEAVALTWSDYDGDSFTIHCSASPDSAIKSTKNRKFRTVPVPAILREKLRPGRGRIAPVRPDAVTRWWLRHRASFGMDGVRLHDLRHAYLTRLAAAGVHPRVMMELAGHESIDVCMSIYTHVTDAARRAAVDAAFS